MIFYIATSTFEWFPGVEIHHSRDLKNWQLCCRPLTRRSQIDMWGDPDSGGIWAPDISFHDGIYYLVYTDVKNYHGIFRDTHNYLVTAGSINGPWSEPVYLNSTGFDPALFFDDGKVWLLNMTNDFRPWKNRFSGISLHEYSINEKSLTGSPEIIFAGTELGFTEGPHMYKQNGFYYLLVAEGGTSYNHAVTMARSKKIEGPYEVDPRNPVLTSRDQPELALQRSGHADLVETQSGDWYMVHLCGRPIPGTKNCILGRETAIQKVFWNKEGWLQLEGGKKSPALSIEDSGLPETAPEAEPARDDFNSPVLGKRYQTLRIPLEEDVLSLASRPGYLRLAGQESLSSPFRQSLVAMRIDSFRCTAETAVEFSPWSVRQMAGIICYYDRLRFHYLHLTWREGTGRVLTILSCEGGEYMYPLGDAENEKAAVSLDGDFPVLLRVCIDHERLQFFYSRPGLEGKWTSIGPALDAKVLSDEYVNRNSFTGAFTGMCCQDLTGENLPAYFDYFEYRND